ncbi:MAG: adenylosuccinate synthase [Planctomycetota bacterium]|nr:MAG: adenylosuccinate synthase [Planctomycetota bacterium]
MASTAVIGLQWGDEGKGKVIDSLAAEADLVVRYAGGNNAGHTVVLHGEKHVLHLIPSGIFHDHALNLVGRGVVVSLEHLAQEMEGLQARGLPVQERLRLDGRCHVIFPYHRHVDRLAETWRGEGRIGTTGRGIGPAYADKVARTGIRLADILHPEYFEHRLRAALAEKNALIAKVYGDAPEPHVRLFEESRALADRFRPLIVDGGELLRQADRAGKRILFEGAQGSLLDLDAGTYPFVTSSWTGVWGIAGGTGFPPNRIGRTYAVAKAYSTRVGEGPMPTELHDELGQRIREAGREYGATTGRPRRCGWFDAVAARYAVELNGLDGVILTNLDVLRGFQPIRVAVAYRLGNRLVRTFPAEVGVLPDLEPVYEDLSGWDQDVGGARRFQELPQPAQEYVRFLERQLGVPIERVSVGPDREQILGGEHARTDLWPSA